MSNEWHDAKKRLPPEHKPVLGYYGGWPKNGCRHVVVHHSKLLGWVDIRRGLMMPGVTHWQELDSP